MDICFGDYSLKSGWLLQIIYPTDASKGDSCSSWFLYFSSRSWIASSRRSFCRLSDWAASILSSLRRSTSKVVLYIFLIPMLFYTSVEISVTTKLTLTKKGGPSVFRPPSVMVLWDEVSALPLLIKLYHNEK